MTPDTVSALSFPGLKRVALPQIRGCGLPPIPGPPRRSPGALPSDFPPGSQDMGITWKSTPASSTFWSATLMDPKTMGPTAATLAAFSIPLILCQIFLQNFAHLKGDTAHGHSAIGKGQIFSFGQDHDIGAVFFQFVVDIPGEGIHQAHEGHHRRYPHQ